MEVLNINVIIIIIIIIFTCVMLSWIVHLYALYGSMSLLSLQGYSSLQYPFDALTPPSSSSSSSVSSSSFHKDHGNT